MFFYGRDGTQNVIAALSELETARLLLGQAAAPLNPSYPRWDAFAAEIARAMETGGKIHVTIDEAGANAVGAWRGPLDAAPGPCRSAVNAALDFFARRAGRGFDRAKVEVIGLGGAKT